MEELKWKSFTLVVNADEDGEDDAQNIAKKLTIAAIRKGLCVLIDDGDQDGEIANLLSLSGQDYRYMKLNQNNCDIIEW